MDIVDPICCCLTNAIENTEHYLLHCYIFTNERTVLFDDLRNIGINYGPLDSSTLSRMLLFGNPKFSDNVNSGIIYAVIKFIVLVDLFMINMTPTIFYFRFIFSVYLTLFFKLI